MPDSMSFMSMELLTLCSTAYELLSFVIRNSVSCDVWSQSFRYPGPEGSSVSASLFRDITLSSILQDTVPLHFFFFFLEHFHLSKQSMD